ncbi:hypothetical protein TRICI_003868 [Trichomonascus ciferrii]|uniref:F-box domain-containing protein n=1 Tax=Trichomonascus ciferrii TaxID=44093 RepID=A0A642V249_9ASCO|nr:hypothetical protein TRICI_003868 [Trichomonascus ciferrii]
MAKPELMCLPNELLEDIADELSTASLLSLQSTCRQLRAVVSRRLWKRVEINFATDKRSPLVQQERWNKHFTGRSSDDRRQVWMVINRNHVEEFFHLYLAGGLSAVLKEVRNMNIVESLEGYGRDPWGVVDEASSPFRNRNYHYLRYLDPEDFPRLELIRVCSSISDEVSDSSLLDLLSRFPRVEKYVWATRLSCQRQKSTDVLMIDAIVSSTTSLSLAFDAQTAQTPNDNVMKSFAPFLPSLTTLQLVGKERERCVMPAAKLKAFLEPAQRLRKLALVRIEVDNPEQVEWMPESVNRLQFVAREDRRHDEPIAYPSLDCPSVRSLYVNMLRGKDTVNLRSLTFTGLTNLFFVSSKRDPDPGFDVALFENNPHLVRVVYNCSSSAGLRVLGDHCGGSLEILSLQRRRSPSGELLQYDVDDLSELSKKCTHLRFLELRASSNQMMNPVRVLKEFVSNCTTLKEVYVVSTGKFVCPTFVPLRINSVSDGYCHHYVGHSSRVFVYKVDVPAFKDYWCAYNRTQ